MLDLPYRCRKMDGPFCIEIENYPSEELNKLLKRKYRHIQFESDVGLPEMNTRIELNDDIPLCESHSRIIYPEEGRDTHNISYVIVNSEKQQGIRIEECVSINQRCDNRVIAANSYELFSKQNYIHREVIVRLNSNKLTKRIYNIKSDCSCTMRQV